MCVHTAELSLVTLGVDSVYTKVEKPWFPKKVLRHRKYHRDCSPCPEPEKKKKNSAIDRNVFQDGCGFSESRTMMEQSQSPTTACQKSLMD